MREALQIYEFETPFTHVAARRVGNARLRKTTYPRGSLYRMEGVRGFEFWEAQRDVLVTSLERRENGVWREWMVDDPLHWFGMEEFVKRLPAGEIVCAGLGLGLMAHHLLKRADIWRIVIVEIDPDVIRLIEPTLPSDARRWIVEDDFYSALRLGHYREVNGILWDLATGKREETRPEFIRARAMMSVYAPGVPFVRFWRQARIEGGSQVKGSVFQFKFLKRRKGTLGFVSKFGGEKPWEPGKWRSVTGRIKLCENGYHCSPNPMQAHRYVATNLLAVVQVRGDFVNDRAIGDPDRRNGKSAWRSMRVLGIYRIGISDYRAFIKFAKTLPVKEGYVLTTPTGFSYGHNNMTDWVQQARLAESFIREHSKKGAVKFNAAAITEWWITRTAAMKPLATA